AEVLDGQLAGAFGAGDEADGGGSDEGGDGVGGRRGVAQVAADAGPPLDLDAADQRHRVDEAGVSAAEGGVLVEAVTGDGGAEAQAALGVVIDRVDLGDVL